MTVTVNHERYPLQKTLDGAAGLTGGAHLALSGLYGSSKAFFLASLFRRSVRPILAVLPDEASAEVFLKDLEFFLGREQVSFYPSTELLPFETQGPHQAIICKRIELLYRLLGQTPFVTVTAVQNLMERVVPKGRLQERVLELKHGGEYPREEVIAGLISSGYNRAAMVEAPGEISVRGGIIDIFPTAFAHPVRMEFFGDLIESIRTFDIGTQRSLTGLEKVQVLPASIIETNEKARERASRNFLDRVDELELVPEKWGPLHDALKSGTDPALLVRLFPLFQKDLTSLFDYLQSDTICALIDPSRVRAGLRAFEGEVAGVEERLLARKEFFIRPGDIYIEAREVTKTLEDFALIEVEGLAGSGTGPRARSNMDLVQDLSIKKRRGTLTLKPLAAKITGWLEGGCEVFITAHNRGQAERTAELLEGYDLRAGITRGADITEGGRAAVHVAIGSVSTGFRLEEEGLVVISEEEVFGERVQKRPPPAKKSEAFLLQLEDLSEGDPIVHTHHGIGVYRGLKRIEIENVENDFLLLEYRDGDRLYLPVWRMDLVSRYHALGGATPQLDRLGSAGWNKTKRRVKKAIERMAAELLKLYARREVSEGFSFSPPNTMFREFEAGFEYEETPDQARAIEECLQDMETDKPMDRLVCGDVGYGKTEVAIRAAFKAALDSKQVAVLVPTTVLAQQHYITFSRRLSPYPVVVEVMSRFRSPKERKEVLRGLASGRVDIVIGTHTLLQRDVVFKDLGLIVIDEEHRFGVRQKERLKEMRHSVDVLTLTATPIPRTLHMSFASIRDLSIINTPPEDRLAVVTEVMRFDSEAIAGAIERELKRGGQVFFVHNRIQSIQEMEDLLKKLVPEARLATAHGQMHERELEKKMLGFINREYDILLSTAIIESGLDIPSANTIIVNRADIFGLAELYQLRGRVGRSSHRAYAYFIIPEPNTLTDDARKRLEVIRELCEPGSGFKVAAYDLEIRGAGELLGTSQSGRIAEVGFDMYTRLLEETVAEMKGTAAEVRVEPEVNLRVSRYIPEDYIPDMRQRLNLYKRLASASGEDALVLMAEELLDRYGRIPEPAENLVNTMRLKVLLKEAGAKELNQQGTRLYIHFDMTAEGPAPHVIDNAVKMAGGEPNRFRINHEGRFTVFMAPDAMPVEEAGYVLKELLNRCYSKESGDSPFKTL